ncbi:SURF1 family protein [Anianabacter salinae]|uniref:SURF1 family protein n=1 Tax=Anianabacter salinae TaxID=2851023 RepID=UPI00225E0A84|nr:SURF1 family protein [Anianabacter salinae]MBV0911307.1 SURF1 family protein [Anianabacter salinae]
MTKRMIVPLLIGIVGAAILIGLGVWQLQRLAWKEAILSDIEARIAAAPVALPASADPEADRYLPVRASGVAGSETAFVLASVKDMGAVYRVISAFATDGRRVLLDRGVVPVAARDRVSTPGQVTVTGNLHWPDEIDSFTPDPDPAEALWFARDVPALAEALGTEPLLIVARTVEPPGDVVTPLPVSTVGVPNDHLEYAVTWFSLCAVWLGMTGFLLSRIRRRTV